MWYDLEPTKGVSIWYLVSGRPNSKSASISNIIYFCIINIKFSDRCYISRIPLQQLESISGLLQLSG